MKLRAFVVEPISYYEELGLRDVLEEKFEVCHPKFLSKENEELIKSCSIVISCLYHSYLSMYIFSIAKFYSIPTIHFSDGIEEWANMTRNRFFIDKGLMMNLPPYANVCFASTLDAKNLYLTMGIKAHVYCPKRIYNGEKIVRKSDMDSPYFLISCANTAYFDSDEFSRLISLYKRVLTALDKHNVKYAFRVFDQHIINSLDIPENKNYLNDNLVTTLHSFSALITTPSSIVIPAMKNNIPVATLDYRDEPMLIQTGWRFHNSCNFDKVIEGLLTQDSSRMLYQKNALVDELDEVEIADILSSLAADTVEKRNSLLEQGQIKYYNSKATINIEYFMRLIYKLKGVKKNLKRFFR